MRLNHLLIIGILILLSPGAFARPCEMLSNTLGEIVVGEAGHVELNNAFPPVTKITTKNNKEDRELGEQGSTYISLTRVTEAGRNYFIQYEEHPSLIYDVCVLNGDKIESHLNCNQDSCIAIDQKFCALSYSMFLVKERKLFVDAINTACQTGRDRICVLLEELRSHHASLVSSLNAVARSHRPDAMKTEFTNARFPTERVESFRQVCRNFGFSLEQDTGPAASRRPPSPGAAAPQ